MALFAIGDLHLSFQTDKSMDQFGGAWLHHEEKVVRNFQAEIGPEDTLVLVGDHSWGRKMNECREDFEFIERLPGRKILTRGNHDMFWDSGSTHKLKTAFSGRLDFLQGAYFCTYQDYALVGTKGYTYEGHDAPDHAAMLIDRELMRLKQSFEAASKAGYSKFIMFLHYPPTSILEEESGFTWMAEQYHTEQVIYAHCHGEERFNDSIQGEFHGIRYSLVSGDYLDWHPKKILD